jgi:hypothetical protein
VFESDEYKSLNAGATVFLPKPVQTDRLMELLRLHLKLEWIQESEASSADASETEAIASTTLVLPPPDILSDLYALALEGDTYGIAEAVERLQQMDTAYSPFSKHLIQLCETFQVKKLQTILQQYLNHR